ncbi:MAG: Usg family protein [Alphaproteobacteria bacterium]|nr:Usg family protein [Alphaproteobacteria bacterium]
MASALQQQLTDYRLTTAEILYWMPDHSNVLQTFIWQDLDLAPRFPVLSRFLAFWHRNLDGKLHRVRVANVGLIQPAEFRYADALFRVH